MLILFACTAILSQKPTCCSMADMAYDPAFLAAHAPPLPLHFRAKSGAMIEFRTPGATGHGFYVPASKSSKAGVLMFHEWWGLNDYIKREAERLHDELGGAQVLAVDLYDGKVASTSAEAGKLMQAMNESRGRELAAGGLAYLKDIGMAKKVGTIGWCFGGGWSQRAAIEGGPDVQACVIYYGMPSTDPADLAKLKAPVLMFWGKKDGFINQKVVDGFVAAMKQAHRSIETHAYDAVHAFANPSNPKFDKAAADDAHTRTLAFFGKLLK